MVALQQPIQERPTFAVFQGFVVSNMIAALHTAGVLPALADTGLTLERAQRDGVADLPLLAACLQYLVQRGLVEESAGTFTLLPLGKDIYRDQGYLVWLLGGYTETFHQLGAFLRGTKRYGQDIVRDGRWVAIGSAEIGKEDVVPYAQRVLETLDFTHVLDIGCGNARFLLSVCERFRCTGVGVDLSPEACEEAVQAAHAKGLSDRVQIVEANAGDIQAIPRLNQTDLVLAFFLLHEILAQGRSVIVEYLATLAAALPPGAHLLIGEVTPPRADRTDELFTPEFSLLHAIMRQWLLPEAGWRDVFHEAGLLLRECIPLGVPGAVLLLAQVPNRA